jgi:peptide-methionine (S)-S-oxide reductase
MTELATLAGGCFWCTEAIFRRLKGVSKVTSGYTGGKTENPSYEQVCTGTTGHAEAIQIEFDPAVISYETILEVFFATHDPTTLNQQGNDIGTQYRSAVFYHSDEQKELADKIVSATKGAVTEVAPYTIFYPAEIDHQQYYEINGKAGYCSYVISPKIHKLLEKYGELVKPGYK